MKKYTLEQLESALRAAGVARDQTLMVHSALIPFNGLENCPPSSLPGRLYEVIRAIIGPGGTIVVPTFTFDFCKGVPFNPRLTPSKAMGSFSEFVRTLPHARRSLHPMQSVAAIGPQAELICAPDTSSGMAEDGPFGPLLKLSARGLLLGAPMLSFSFVHFVEERSAVPYRFWKTFTGPYGDEGAPKSYQMFVRDLELDPVIELESTEKILLQEGKLSVGSVGGALIKSFLIMDFYEIVMSRLREDPYWLLKTRPGGSTPL